MGEFDTIQEKKRELNSMKIYLSMITDISVAVEEYFRLLDTPENEKYPLVASVFNSVKERLNLKGDEWTTK